MPFEEKTNPRKYGIMYTEHEGRWPEFVMFETPEERDSIYQKLIETGELSIPDYYIEKTAFPVMIGKFDADETYHRKKSIWGNTTIDIVPTE